MEIAIEPIAEPAEPEVEIVERKGLGHPDSICDALAEQWSLALSRHYLEHHGAILHHNVDKALLVGGAAAPRFGGGRVLEPIMIYLAGRAISDVRGVARAGRGARRAAARRAWLRANLRGIDVERHVQLHPLVRRGSAELVDLFGAGGPRLANDTSLGVGYAPLSRARGARARRRAAPHVARAARRVSGSRRGRQGDGHAPGCAFPPHRGGRPRGPPPRRTRRRIARRAPASPRRRARRRARSATRRSRWR